MFKWFLPAGNSDIEKLIDSLLKIDYVELKDFSFNRRFGIYAKPLRRRGILKMYYDDVARETIGKLEVKDVTKRFLPGKHVEYDFNINIPSGKKVKIPWL